ncbi:MAG: hypothetical protein JJE22_11035 [Bacteroidia bacterium]|nr:hypothetical protein [Bacteroidia bacterium]
MQKIVFITGTTSGFGEVCAEKFAENGYDLIISYTQQADAIYFNRTTA